MKQWSTIMLAEILLVWCGFLRRFSNVIRYYRAYRRAVSELTALDDRELQDIGTSRSCIRWIAQQTALDAVTRL
jgi:uncharacterized protein YjiS (DUF1127 family)